MVATPEEKVKSFLDFSRSEIVSYGVFFGGKVNLIRRNFKDFYLSESVFMATFFRFESEHRINVTK